MDPQTRPGATVWVALDGFGVEVRGALAARLRAQPELIPTTRLVATAPREGVNAAVAAIADLLAIPALPVAGERVIVHCWVVVDTGETAGVAPWVSELLDRLAGERIGVRLGLLVRQLTYGASQASRALAHRQMRDLVESVLAPGRGGHAKTTVVVVTDRDGRGRRILPAACTVAAARFAEFVLVADPLRCSDPAVTRTFRPAAVADSGAGGVWETLPVFVAPAVRVVEYPAARLRQARAAKLRTALYRALEEPAPPEWTPNTPSLARVAVAADLSWPVLSPPSWIPSLRRPLDEERERVIAACASWVAEATAWRRRERAGFQTKAALIEEWSRQSRGHYEEQLRVLSQRALITDSLPGYFPLLDRFLLHCAADLRAARDELDPPPGAGDARMAPDVADPAEIMATADPALAVLERRINIRLLAQVAFLSTLVIWVLLASVLREVYDVGQRVFPGWSRPDVLRLWVWTGLPIAAGMLVVSWLTTRRARVALDLAFAAVHERAMAWAEESRCALTSALETVGATCHATNLDHLMRTVETRRDRLDTLRRANVDAGYERVPTGAEANGDPFTRIVVPADVGSPLLDPVWGRRIVHAFRKTAVGQTWDAIDPASFDAQVQRVAADALDEPASTPHDGWRLLDAALPTALPNVGDLLALPVPGGQRAVAWACTALLAVPRQLIDKPWSAGRDWRVIPAFDDERVYAVQIRYGLTGADLFGGKSAALGKEANDDLVPRTHRNGDRDGDDDRLADAGNPRRCAVPLRLGRASAA